VWNEQFTIDMAAFIDSVEDSGSIALPVYHEHFVVELWDWVRLVLSFHCVAMMKLSGAGSLQQPRQSWLRARAIIKRYRTSRPEILSALA
jgi:hypothetical protein